MTRSFAFTSANRQIYPLPLVNSLGNPFIGAATSVAHGYPNSHN
ncbi:hypothetical protein [Spirosoma luteum]|nr:hypothetical protein [Spirosoma luteum]